LAQLVLNLKDAHRRAIREQLETEGVSLGILFTHHAQRNPMAGGGDSLLTGERELGRDPVDPAWKPDLGADGSTPSTTSTQILSLFLIAQSMDTPQRNGAGGGALRDPATNAVHTEPGLVCDSFHILPE
jgi:hypothetical protein